MKDSSFDAPSPILDSTKTISEKDSTQTQDSVAKGNTIALSPNAIKQIVNYKAKDSVAINLDERKAFLYTEGTIDYQGMVMKADNVVVDFDKQLLSARGVVDSGGEYKGRPYFKQGEDEYNADSITFNYETKKGLITGVVTQEGDGFLHGNTVKKVNDSVMYLNSGMYTTCNYAHPHFALNFTKSKLITGNMIVTGPAYVTIRDIPTPLALPFAFFPLTHGVTSGIIIPSYGWQNGRGYYLKEGGYYWAINDYSDLALLGEIYTNLSWAAEAKSNYYKRYKYKGNIDVRYGRTKEGIRGDTNTYNIYSDFKVSWTHNQDAKANPNSRFSANVNLQSRNYSKNTTNRNDYFNSTTTSSISYSTQLGSAFNLAASAREDYNAQTGIMSIKLPSLSLSSNTFYPFRRKQASGAYRWYENISASYVLNADNNVSTIDSLILQRSVFNKMQYGVQHSLPVQSSVKVLKYFNWNNSISYTERWHWSTINKDIDESGSLVIDTIRGFHANRSFSYNSSLTTRLYGMFNFKYGPVKAIRHVINPSLSFTYHPDFGSDRLGYWKQYTDTTGYVHRYSIFEQSLYGGPPDGRSGQLAFNVSNQLEMKVKSMRDTTTDAKKVVLIENLSASMYYDIAKDSLNWSDLNISGRTTLFKNLVINYSGLFTPYVVDSLGNKHNQLLFNEVGKVFQKSNATWSAQLSWSLNNNTFKKSAGKESTHGEAITPILQSPYNNQPSIFMGNYVDFSVPWNLSFSYTFNYVSTYVASQYNFKSNIVQSLSMSGNFSLTDKWKVNFSTGYDFVNHGMSYTSIDIYRDLHCWEMRFNWTPFGYYKSWSFQINIKADALKDVKYKKDHPYQSNQGYYSY
ncbi:MAG: LPS-assembly protein LptD [Bacteroidales bacterium]|nr:LPS-assembly protein LptD [Bacteroidales bacterium]